MLELRSHKLATASDVIRAIGALRSSLEDFITYSQYAAIKYKVNTLNCFICCKVEGALELLGFISYQ